MVAIDTDDEIHRQIRHHVVMGTATPDFSMDRASITPVLNGGTISEVFIYCFTAVAGVVVFTVAAHTPPVGFGCVPAVFTAFAAWVCAGMVFTVKVTVSLPPCCPRTRGVKPGTDTSPIGSLPAGREAQR